MPRVWTEPRRTKKYPRGEVVRHVLDGSPKKYTSPAYATKREALRAADELRDRLGRTVRKRHSSAPVQPVQDLPLMHVLEAWGRAMLSATPPEIQPTTLVDYRQTFKRLIARHEWKTTRDVTAGELKGIRDANNGVGFKRPYAYLRSVLRWAKSELGQWVDPIFFEKIPTPRRNRSVLTGLDKVRPCHVAMLIEEARTQYSLNFAALLHCFALFGARGASYARMNVEHYVQARRVFDILHVKHANRLVHPLFRKTCEYLDAIILDDDGKERDPGEPLFLSPWGTRWKLSKRGQSDQMGQWIRRLSVGIQRQQLAAAKRDKRDPPPAALLFPRILSYDLKKFAISRMLDGDAPWPKPLSARKAMSFTGHLTEEQVLKYGRANMTDLRELTGDIEPINLDSKVCFFEQAIIAEGANAGANSDLPRPEVTAEPEPDLRISAYLPRKTASAR